MCVFKCNTPTLYLQTQFDISVSSELMAILALTKSLKDMKERIGECREGDSCGSGRAGGVGVGEINTCPCGTLQHLVTAQTDLWVFWSWESISV